MCTEEKRNWGKRLKQVNRGDWLRSPTNIKGANKDAKIYVGRSTTVHNLLFCAHTLCMKYVTNTFLLVGSSVRGKQLLCFVHGQGQKSEQKHTTKNFVGLHNHSPLLTMAKRTIRLVCTSVVLFSSLLLRSYMARVRPKPYLILEVRIHFSSCL